MSNEAKQVQPTKDNGVFDHSKSKTNEVVGFDAGETTDKANELLSKGLERSEEGGKFSHLMEELYNSDLTRKELCMLIGFQIMDAVRKDPLEEMLGQLGQD